MCLWGIQRENSVLCKNGIKFGNTICLFLSQLIIKWLPKRKLSGDRGSSAHKYARNRKPIELFQVGPQYHGCLLHLPQSAMLGRPYRGQCGSCCSERLIRVHYRPSCCKLLLRHPKSHSLLHHSPLSRGKRGKKETFKFLENPNTRKRNCYQVISYCT